MFPKLSDKNTLPTLDQPSYFTIFVEFKFSILTIIFKSPFIKLPDGFTEALTLVALIVILMSPRCTVFDFSQVLGIKTENNKSPKLPRITQEKQMPKIPIIPSPFFFRGTASNGGASCNGGSDTGGGINNFVSNPQFGHVTVCPAASLGNAICSPQRLQLHLESLLRVILSECPVVWRWISLPCVNN